MTYPDPASEGGKADWVAILRDTLPYVDVFLPSFEELLFMLRREQNDAPQKASPDGNVLNGLTPELLSSLGGQLIDMGVKMAVIKLGSRGLYLRTASEEKIAAMGRCAPADLRAWANANCGRPASRWRWLAPPVRATPPSRAFLSGLLRRDGPGPGVDGPWRWAPATWKPRTPCRAGCAPGKTPCARIAAGLGASASGLAQTGLA